MDWAVALAADCSITRVDAGGLQLNDLRIDRRVGKFIGGLGNDQRSLRPETRCVTL